MNQYRKKPVVVEAIQYTALTCREIHAWMGRDHGPYDDRDDPCGRGVIQIETLEGTMTANPGDWIIKGVRGEFYPCKPDIFDFTYEPVVQRMLAKNQPCGCVVCTCEDEVRCHGCGAHKCGKPVDECCFDTRGPDLVYEDEPTPVEQDAAFQQAKADFAVLSNGDPKKVIVNSDAAIAHAAAWERLRDYFRRSV